MGDDSADTQYPATGQVRSPPGHRAWGEHGTQVSPLRNAQPPVWARSAFRHTRGSVVNVAQLELPPLTLLVSCCAAADGVTAFVLSTVPPRQHDDTVVALLEAVAAVETATAAVCPTDEEQAS